MIAHARCNSITIPPEFANGISRQEAEDLFRRDLVRFENAIKRDITVPLYQREYDALVSLVFNAGANFLNTGGAGGGNTNIKTNINAGRYNAGADEMADVVNSNGHRQCGLVRRRRAEIDLFKHGNYEGNTNTYTCH